MPLPQISLGVAVEGGFLRPAEGGGFLGKRSFLGFGVGEAYFGIFSFMF